MKSLSTGSVVRQPSKTRTTATIVLSNCRVKIPTKRLQDISFWDIHAATVTRISLLLLQKGLTSMNTGQCTTKTVNCYAFNPAFKEARFKFCCHHSRSLIINIAYCWIQISIFFSLNIYLNVSLLVERKTQITLPCRVTFLRYCFYIRYLDHIEHVWCYKMWKQKTLLEWTAILFTGLVLHWVWVGNLMSLASRSPNFPTGYTRRWKVHY